MAEKFFGITDTGKLRDNNEDNFIAQQVVKNRFIVAAVIDGVGGYEGGEVAAEVARKSILDYISIPSGDILTMLREAVSSANENIYKEKLKSTGKEKMACVLTVVVLEKKSNKFYYAHVGDTRLYLLRDESLVKVTQDHSFVGYLEDNGRLNEEEAMRHPKRNEINKALGFSDHISNPAEFIETGESPFLPGDMLLLCSDGLTDMVNKTTIKSILSRKNSIQEKAEALVDAANEAGGKDNITVVIVHNDSKPVKQAALKPGIPSIHNEEPATLIQPQPTSQTVSNQRGNRNGLIFLLTIIILALLGLLAWQWFSDTPAKQQHEANRSDTLVTPASSGLQSAIAALTSDTLDLSSTADDSIYLTRNLSVSRDVLYVKGNGKTITGSGSGNTSSRIIIGPEVESIVFDSLVFSNILIEVNVQNISALRFRNVKFINSRFNIAHQIPSSDSLYTGTIFEMESIRER